METKKRKEIEFLKFNRLLMKKAPEGYTPWYFPIKHNSKVPDGYEIGRRAPKDFREKEAKCKAGSWKGNHARLTKEEAIEWIRKGGNLGIAGRREDSLVPVDLDCDEEVKELKPTLIVKTRSRIGAHGYYFADPEDKKLPCNIPTDKGELRSSDEYLLAPGSYVPVSEEERKKLKDDSLAGYYTVEKELPAATITFDELPSIFLEKVKRDKEKRKKIEKLRKNSKPFNPKQGSGECSALFDLTIRDVLPAGVYSEAKNGRTEHPLHGSGTGINFSVEGELAHCWRHLVSLNALQYLVVKSGYLRCEEAGTSHKNGGAGPSYVIGDDGAIFHAWLQAKKDGIIPDDDPIPFRAIRYIGRKHKVCSKEVIDKFPKEMLPPKAYNKVLKIVEVKY